MFDATAFLRDNCGSPAELVSTLRHYGFAAPSEAAAEKWFSRGTIPGGWLPIVLAMLELERGEAAPVSKYLRNSHG